MNLTRVQSIGFLLVVYMGFGAVLIVGAGVAISSIFHPLIPSSINTKHGEEIFSHRCAGCHSVLPDQIGGLGPNLSNIGQIAAQRIDGQTAEQYILTSILYPDTYRVNSAGGPMPTGTVAGLADESLLSLVAYLINQGGTIDEEKLFALELDSQALKEKTITLSVEQLKHGWNLFFNELGCSACHSILGLPGDNLRAPSLAKAGQLTEDYVLRSIRDPSADIADQWRMAKISMNDGSLVSGRVLRQANNFTTILMKSSSGQRLLETKLISRSDIEEITLAKDSPMPPYTLTIRDEQAIAAFLSVLSGE